MKFRILEKRGKFRIEVYTKTGVTRGTEEVDCKVDKTLFKKVVERTYRTTEENEMGWVALMNDASYQKFSTLWTAGGFNYWPGASDAPKPPERAEFGSYKQAENFIKKHYGLEGVNAIEEPEWRVV